MKRVVLILTVFLCVSSATAAGSVSRIDLTLTSHAPELMRADGGLYRVGMKGFCARRCPGDPALPFKTVRVLVPPDIVWETLRLHVVASDERPLDGRYDILPTPPSRPMGDVHSPSLDKGGERANVVNGRNRAIYGRDAVFPAAPLELASHAQKRKWMFARITFSPVRYNPHKRELTHCRRVDLQLIFERDPRRLDPVALQDPVMSECIPGMVENFDQAALWYPQPTRPRDARNGGHDYVIITRQAIVDGSDRLDNFIGHKGFRGHSVRIVTEADYQGLSGPPPDSDCEKIRKWLIDNYLAESIEYVLLIGDPTPDGTSVDSVPMKMCWPRKGNAKYESGPTDWYYADLTGNWDPDGDEFYGTFSDYSSGGVDLSAEVYVGRIPVYDSDYAQLDSILDKVMTYANATQIDWRRSCMLPATFLTETYTGAHWTEQMRDDFLLPAGYRTWRLYEQGSADNGLVTPYPSEEELRGGTVVRDRWLAEHWGIVAWSGHGNQSSVQVGPNENPDGLLFGSWQAPSLDDTHPSFVYQASCLNGYPEEPGNLQYALLKNGAIGAVAASRVSFGSFSVSGGDFYGDFDNTPGNQAIGYQFLLRIVDGQPAGRALFEGKEAASAFIGSVNSSLMNSFLFNLYGDPGIAIESSSGETSDLQYKGIALNVNDAVVDLDLSIVNQKDIAYASPSTVAVYLSLDTVVTANDYRIGGMTVPAMGPGSVFYTGLTKDVRFVMPPIPEGTYHVAVVLDVDDTVAEGDGEDNNRHAITSPTVFVPPRPDSPENVQASDGTYALVRVTWNPAALATHYKVYRSNLEGTFNSQAVSDWITDTYFDDASAGLGSVYYYTVISAINSAGVRPSSFSTLDSGFAGADALVEDIARDCREVHHYQFSTTNVGWCVVGIRAGGDDDNVWRPHLYSDASFDSLLVSAPSAPGFSFILADLNHLSRDTFAVFAEPIGPAQFDNPFTGVEFEGPDDALGLGTNSISIFEGIKVYDVPLAVGTYTFAVRRTSGPGDPGMALFSSAGGSYYRSHEQFVAQGEGTDTEKQFTYTVTANDTYALCVWAAEFANLQISLVALEPGLWQGTVSTDWHTPGNWEDLQVPTASVDVTLPPGKARYPFVDADAACRKLTVESGASLAVENATLEMVSLTVRGYVDLNDYGILDVANSVTWEAGSSADMEFLSLIDVGGGWNFEAGANVQLTDGAVRFLSGQSAFIRSQEANCRMALVQNSKPASFLAVSAKSTAPLRIRNLVNNGGATFWSFSPHAVMFDGYLNNNGGSVRMFNGSLVFDGDPGSTPLKMAGDSALRSLVIRTTGNPLRISDAYTNRLLVTSDLVIESGGLEAQNNNVAVGGMWSNGLGSAGFSAGTGTVTFVGSLDQDVYGSNTFYALDIDKDGGVVRFHGPTEVLADAIFAGGTGFVHDAFSVAGVLDLNAMGGGIVAGTNGQVSVASLDLGGTLGCRSGGRMVADDIVDAGIRGRIVVEGGEMDLHQGTTGGETLEMEGHVEIHAGVLNIHGGFGPLRWVARDNDLDFMMSGGELRVMDRGISIWNGSGNLDADITGGTIRLAGDFNCSRPGFQPQGGTLIMAGASAASIDVVERSYLAGVAIEGAGSVTSTSDLYCEGDFAIRQGTFVAPRLMEVGGSWSNGVGPAAFAEGTGTVAFVGARRAEILTDELFYNVTVDKTVDSFDGLTIVSDRGVYVRNDLALLDGCLELNTRSHLRVGRDLLIDADAGLNANDDLVRVTLGGDWVNRNRGFDLAHGFTPGDDIYGSSLVTFDGDSSQHVETEALEETFYHMVIDQPGGSFRPRDNIRVAGSCTLRNGAWRYSVAGLTHTFLDNLTIEPTALFNDDTGLVRFEGVDHQVLDDRSTNSVFGDLVIAKSISSVALEVASQLHCAPGHTLTVDEGILDVNGQSLLCEGDLSVNAGGTLRVGAGGVVDVGDGHSMAVHAYGRLRLAGTSRMNASIRGYAGGRYGLSINARGDIGAVHATFSDMDANGVLVNPGAWVDPNMAFTSCTFQNGAAGGALLNVNNSQDLVVERAIFPAGAGKGSYNARKTADTGSLSFVAATGIHSGESFEDDPHRRIHWHTGGPVSLLVAGPAYCTKGGTYSFLATGQGEHMFMPLTFAWAVTDQQGYQHDVTGATDSRSAMWGKAGRKQITVTVSNSEGSAETLHAVTVLPLVVEDLVVSQGRTGSNTVVNLVLGGTSAASSYRVESAAFPGARWLAAGPGGDRVPGADRVTVWRDTGGPGRDLNANRSRCYRAVLIE